MHPLQHGGYLVVHVDHLDRPTEPLAAPLEVVVQFECHCDNQHDWLYHGLCELVTRLESDPIHMTFEPPDDPF